MPDLSLKNLWDIYRAARDLPDEQRRAFVESASPDPARVREILELLEASGSGLSALPPPAAAAAPPGSKAGLRLGRYLTGELIGRGGMGEVYSARDEELGRTVALKFLGGLGAGLSVMAERFIGEAKAASALNHPNIVTIHEVIRSDNDLAFAMELVEGQPLRNLISSGPLPTDQVVRIGRQCAEALAAAHAHGIIHRDIKPENIMVRPDGYVKVLDFGLARNVDSNSLASSIAGLPVGTLRYMSPEQARGETLNAATDVFSLGLVLWEALVGRHPFGGVSPLETCHRIMERSAEEPSKYQSGVPPELDRLLGEMLRKNPAERPDCARISSRLARCEAGGAAPAVRPRRGMVVPALAVAAATCVAAWVLWRPAAGTASPPSPLEILPATSYDGSETDPSFSPDGRQIAFAWAREGKSHIFVKLLGAGDPLPLTKGAGADVYPAWSPDGLSIAFLRWPTTGGKLGLMTVPALGGVERKIAEVDDPQGYPRPIAWTADSKSLAVRDLGPEGSTVFLISVETGERKQIAPPGPAWACLPLPSPDGRYVAFERIHAPGQARLCWVPAAGGGPEQCLPETAELQGAAWASDSRTLIYANRLGLFTRPLTGGAQTKIADGRFDGLTASRTGYRLAFTRNYSDINIWRAPINGGQPEKLDASSAEDSEPDYSPDGSKILFRSRRTGTFELFVASSDGSNLQQITTLAGHTGSARWSPDGKQIAFGSTPAGRREGIIYTVPAGGGPPRPLTSGSDLSIVPTWSRDGRYIYFLRNEPGSLWKIPAEGGTATLVSNLETLDATESPDGQYLYFRKSRTIPGIWRMPVSGGNQAVLLAGTESVASRYWQLMKDGIGFIDNAGPQPVFKFLDYRTNRIRQLARLPAHRLVVGPRGMAVSPNGKDIAFTSEDLTLSDVLLINDYRAGASTR